MDYLFTVQPGDRWIYEHKDQLKQSLQELELKGEWYDGLPPEKVMRRNRFTSSVVIHSMYDIICFRLDFIKNHLDVYKCNKGQMDTYRNGGAIKDPYFSLRVYCLDYFDTNDGELDSIYLVDARHFEEY